MLNVEIDMTKCTKCLECIEVCPAGVLELSEGWPAHVYTEHCLECKACLNICPEDAIRSFE